MDFSITFDRRPAILHDLVDICAFYQTQANVGMAEVVSGARLTAAISFQFLFIENGVKQFALSF